MTNVNLNKDIASLTTIPESSLARLSEKVEWCIVNALQEALISKEISTTIDLGYGTLIIGIDEDVVKYKFMPSKNLEVGIKNIVEIGENVLVKNVDKCLVNKITRVYKDFI